MVPIEPQRLFTFTISEELETCIAAYCKKHKLTKSEFGRQAFAAMLGKPDLANTVRMGRPRKEGGKL